MKFGLAILAATLLAGCGSSAGTAPSPLTGVWVNHHLSSRQQLPDSLQYTLRVLPDGSFLMGGGTAPTRIGKAVIEGDKFVLTPSRMPGIEKKPEGAHIPGMDPMTATIEPTGQDLTINGTEKGSLRFRKQAEIKTGPTTVTPDEEKVVGHYAAEVDWQKVPKDSEQLLKDLQPFFFAEFRSDNKFTLVVSYTLQGTWKLKGDKIECKFDSIAQPVDLDFKDGVLTPPPTAGKASPYFFKKSEAL